MPYVMIPDGFSLKKVTRAQKDAVDAKRRHDDVLAILNNDNTPLVVGGLVAVQTTNSVIASLEERLGTLSDDVKQAVEEGVAKVEKELVTDPKNWFERKLDRSKKRLEELDLSRLA